MSMEFLNKYLDAFKMKHMNHLIAELNVYLAVNSNFIVTFFLMLSHEYL